MNTSRKDYITQYWVGLMDGDGSIQVNHWRHKSLQYRLIIKLKFSQENLFLLREISKFVGGNVRVQPDKKFVLWVENHSSKIREIVKQFHKYPPLTSRLCLQLKFLLECFKRNSVTWYLENRASKYRESKNTRESLESEKVSSRAYYKGWLSGFIEAEGCFCVRENSSKNCSFIIAQVGDRYILENIRDEFGASNMIRSIKAKQRQDRQTLAKVELAHASPSERTLFFFETYRKDVLKRIIAHCTEYPLLGEKKKSFLLFHKKII